MRRPRIVVVGAGFAGFHAARRLARLARGAAEVTVVNSTDYFLYLPLLPEVAGGILDPRRILAPLDSTLPGTRLVVGDVRDIDLGRRRLTYVDTEDRAGELPYDRLVLAVGSVNELLPVPGVTQHAHGFRGVPEALYLRDHLVRQIELADAVDDPAECAARCTFVVVGAGYTGTEVAAQGHLFTAELARRRPRLAGQPLRWLLLDIADRVLPELDPQLSGAADRVLRRRGIQVRLGTSVRSAMPDGVLLSDGEYVPSRSLIWCVGVRPDPLVDRLGLPTEKGRLVVDEYLAVPGHPELFACGDAAAVPDLARPGEIAPMTAQHAVRQGRTAAQSVAASYGVGRRRRYAHRDLGFVVDLGGWQAAADPLGVPLSGPLAKAVTRGYHLLSIPANRARIASDWLLESVLPRQSVQLGLVRSRAVPLDARATEGAEPTGVAAGSAGGRASG